MKVGGLIEAACSARFLRPFFAGFPPMKVGGLIEAPVMRWFVFVAIVVFPPMKVGGLIEAHDAVSTLPFRF